MMNSIQNLTAVQLNKLASIQKQIEALEQAKATILSTEKAEAKAIKPAIKIKAKRKMSKAGKARIIAALNKRCAKYRSEKAGKAGKAKAAKPVKVVAVQKAKTAGK